MPMPKFFLKVLRKTINVLDNSILSSAVMTSFPESDVQQFLFERSIFE
jgi:hypothetical protein